MQRPILIGNIATEQLGQVWVGLSEHGLVAVEFGVSRRTFESSVRNLTGREARLVSGVAEVTDAACEIAEYLRGGRRGFDIRIDWSILASDFQRAALRAVTAIPYGSTRTYGQIAAQIGNPNASRAMGGANATNPMPLVIPCHRVIGSDGKLHGYGGTGGLRTKQWLLDLERSRASALVTEA